MPQGVIAIAALATAAVSTGASIYEGNKANKAAQQSVAIQQQQADLQAARQRRDAIRASRLAYSTAVQTANNQGVSMSSSAAGGQGSIVSQMSDNLSFLDQYNTFSDQASKAMGRAKAASASSNVFGDVADLGTTVFKNSAEISDSVKKVFKS